MARPFLVLSLHCSTILLLFLDMEEGMCMGPVIWMTVIYFSVLSRLH